MAPIICRKSRVVYYPAPKNASTTLRGLFFLMENGREFVPFVINGTYIDLFGLYRHSQLFERTATPDGYERVAVVRDPIRRFKANYRWLVTAGNADFGEKPEINDFVSRFEVLRTRTPKSLFHLQPQSAFLGNDLGYFNRVFKVEELGDMIVYLNGRSGLDLALPWENRTRETSDELSPDSTAKLRDLYRVDYKLFGGLYEATG
jgi:hypothetical protein